MGHVGLLPQAISVVGGFRAQGRTAVRARELVDDALRLQDAGCFAIVLECVPANVAEAITDTLEVPTIGIGAGGQTSGQVLVYHDMLGMLRYVRVLCIILTYGILFWIFLVSTHFQDFILAKSSTPRTVCSEVL